LIHYNFYQSQGDDLNSDGNTGVHPEPEHFKEELGGGQVANANENWDLDNTASHNFWRAGVNPAQLGDNPFTHYLEEQPGYENAALNNNRWGIDGYDPIIQYISAKFKLHFGRR
jgi:hypothetical protein